MQLSVFLREPSAPLRYALAILAIVLVTAATTFVMPSFGAYSPIILYLPVVLFSAWFGGLGPGLLSTFLSALIAAYYFFAPQYSLNVSDPTAAAQLIAFLGGGAVISVLAENLQRFKSIAHESENTVRRERERLRVMLASIGDGVVATDTAGRVTFMNPMAELLTGWRQHEALGRSASDVIRTVNEVTRSPLENPSQRSMREGVGLDHTNHAILIAKNGTELPIHESGAPIRGADGEILGGVLTFHDVREYRTVEKERSLLAQIVTSSEDAIFSKNLEGTIESWNAAAERIFGYTAREAIGQPIRLIIPPDRLEEERLIVERIGRGERMEHFETVRVAKDGRLLDISMSISPIKDVYGRIVGASKIARDITERKRSDSERGRLESERAAREQAEAANRSKDDFVAIVSHELRAPLHVILGWAQLLRAGGVAPSKTAHALETIERCAKTQSQLIDDLLDVSRVITGKLKLNAEIVDPSHIIQTTLDLARPAAEAKAITLQIDLAAPGSLVRADPVRLEQIAWNLVSNAIKFTPRNGRIEVSLERRKSHIEIVVRDSGIGISPRFLPFVFEPFRQATAGSGRKHGGLGLGMAIVRHLVKLHGGTVRGESPGEGRGATFTVTLPLARREEAPPPDERFGSTRPVSAGRAFQLSGLRIVIVDDDPEMRELLTVMLTRRGAEVTACASAREALDAVGRVNPSLLISDIGMPDEDGYSLIRKVRAKEKQQGRTLPAIALTGFAKPEDRALVLGAGFQVYVSKPVEANELFTIIASMTGRLRSGEEPEVFAA